MYTCVCVYVCVCVCVCVCEKFQSMVMIYMKNISPARVHKTDGCIHVYVCMHVCMRVYTRMHRMRVYIHILVFCKQIILFTHMFLVSCKLF